MGFRVSGFRVQGFVRHSSFFAVIVGLELVFLDGGGFYIAFNEASAPRSSVRFDAQAPFQRHDVRPARSL